HLSPDDSWQRIQSTGDFLGRLTSLFGVARDADVGFSYPLRHVQTGCIVVATVRDGTPGFASLGEAPFEVVRALEDALENAPLADCEVIHRSFDATGRHIFVRSGVKKGRAFDLHAGKAPALEGDLASGR